MQCKSTGGAEQGWSWLSAVLVPWPSGWCWTRRGQNGKLADIVNTLPTIRTFIMQHNWVTRDTRNYHRDLKKTLIKTPLSAQSKSVSSEDPVSDWVAEVVWGWRGWCVRGGGPCVCMTAASGLTTAVRRAHHEGEHNRTRCEFSTIYHTNIYHAEREQMKSFRKPLLWLFFFAERMFPQVVPTVKQVSVCLETTCGYLLWGKRQILIIIL